MAGVDVAFTELWAELELFQQPDLLVSELDLATHRWSFTKREEIAILRDQGVRVPDIAPRLRRAPSTISRELRRNAATRSDGLEYRASTAQWHSAQRAKHPKIAKLAANDQLRSYVQDRLAGTVMAEDGMRA